MKELDTFNSPSNLELVNRSLPPHHQRPLLSYSQSITPDDVLAIINQYMNLCLETGRQPTSAGLALAFNMSFKELKELLRSDSAHARAFQRGVMMIADQVEGNMISGKGTAPGLIFWLKNLMEWEDKSEVVSTRKTAGEYLRSLREGSLDGTIVE